MAGLAPGGGRREEDDDGGFTFPSSWGGTAPIPAWGIGDNLNRQQQHARAPSPPGSDRRGNQYPEDEYDSGDLQASSDAMFATAAGSHAQTPSAGGLQAWSTPGGRSPGAASTSPGGAWPPQAHAAQQYSSGGHPAYGADEWGDDMSFGQQVQDYSRPQRLADGSGHAESGGRHLPLPVEQTGLQEGPDDEAEQVRGEGRATSGRGLRVVQLYICTGSACCHVPVTEALDGSVPLQEWRGDRRSNPTQPFVRSLFHKQQQQPGARHSGGKGGATRGVGSKGNSPEPPGVAEVERARLLEEELSKVQQVRARERRRRGAE